MRAVGFVSVVLACLAGCSLTIPDLTSNFGKDAGTDGGADAGDGGADAGDGGSDAGDGGSDAGDGGSDAGDGGSDAGDGGSDAGIDAGFSCTAYTDAAVCADFDTGPLTKGWQILGMRGLPITTAELTDAGVSPPFALRMQSTQWIDAGDETGIHLDSETQPPCDGAHLSFSVRFDTAFDGDLAVAHVYAAPNFVITIILSPSNAALGQDVFTSPHGLSLKLGQWYDVDFDVDWVGGAVNLLVGGATVASTSVAAPTPTACDLRVGLAYFAGPAEPQTVLFDNILYRLR